MEHDDLVAPIKRYLRNCGLTATKSVEDLWEDTGLLGVHESSVMVACVSAEFDYSQQCQKELEFAVDRQKPIVMIAMPQYRFPGIEIKSFIF